MDDDNDFLRIPLLAGHEIRLYAGHWFEAHVWPLSDGGWVYQDVVQTDMGDSMGVVDSQTVLYSADQLEEVVQKIRGESDSWSTVYDIQKMPIPFDMRNPRSEYEG